MALTRLDNLYSSKTGKYLYVSPDDFNATDALDNRGNSPLRPFKTIQRAFIEVSRYSFLPADGGISTPDRFDQFTIMLMPGNHYIDNRPGLVDTNSIPEFGFQQALNQWTDNSNLISLILTMFSTSLTTRKVALFFLGVHLLLVTICAVLLFAPSTSLTLLIDLKKDLLSSM